MNLRAAKDFLEGIEPTVLNENLPSYQARRAIEVAHLGLPIGEVAKSEGVPVLVVRRSLSWAAANMEKEIRRANRP